jgi:hypothetical protein
VERSAGQPPDQPRPESAPTPVAVPEEELPATKADVRALRRWVAVAGVWAVAATAIAIIALVDQDESSNQDGTGDSASQLSRVQRALDRRLDGLEENVRDLPQSEDVRRLEGRLQQAEERSSQASEDAGTANETVGDLERRVEDLEQQVEEQQQGGGGAPGPDEGQP